MRTTKEDAVEQGYIPRKCADVIDERMSLRLRKAAINAQWGNLDLKQLVRDAYWQGVFDAVGQMTNSFEIGVDRKPGFMQRQRKSRSSR